MDDKRKEQYHETVTREPIMVTDEDERLVNSFFNSHPIEVSDQGFSHRVMRHLPKTAWQMNRIWTIVCTLLGILLLFLNKGVQALCGSISGLWADLSTNMLYHQSLLMTYLALICVLMVGGYMAATSER
ncbi:MAG: DUF5056 domain-containing protein [Prevotella sp.]|nr:DUF5056 domain-containing protein [Prevotella sp.]